MIEIDFNGNPFDDSKDIKGDFVVKMSDIDKVNSMVTTSYFNVKHNPANPYEKGYSVTLDTSKHERYGFIQNIKPTTVGRVSTILGPSLVNISFDSTVPATVKNVPVSHLTCKGGFMQKLKVFFKSLSFVKNFIIKKINKKGKK